MMMDLPPLPSTESPNRFLMTKEFPVAHNPELCAIQDELVVKFGLEYDQLKVIGTSTGHVLVKEC